MSAQPGRTAVEPLRLAAPQEAAPLADFLERLLRYDRAAAVRLQTAGSTLAVFARIPLGQTGPLVVRTARLAQPHPLDVTVSAGQWLDELTRALEARAAETQATQTQAAQTQAAQTPTTEAAAHGGAGTATGTGTAERDADAGTELTLPPAITGPAWAGLLPPRSGWEHVEDLATAPLAAAVAAAITEFRKAAEAATGGDALAEAIWARRVHPSGLTLRALHAAHLTGLLRQAPTIALHRHPAWLRLTAPRGAVAVRRSAPGLGLSVTPS
jgi:hypothetical protein